MPTPSPTPSTSSSGASKKRKQMDVVDNVLAIAVNQLNSISDKKSSGCEIFGSMVASEISSMNNIQRQLAKKIINDVLHLGSMERLSEDHQIVCLRGSNEFLA
ncbi:hypothetical protein Pcinc_004533 [Petrolisthes cinctipes]|uniref:Uncharacterized protein n=1 Tax=Petrolisthes cinctipes TaxID=88211 RepID=A0AAE1GGV1_PETCI|nr:hypothetical protein Pcinc_004533 [Petrolisthes cinctipes]